LQEVPVTDKPSASYQIKPFPPMRRLVIDVLRVAERKHMIHGLIEVDVTSARQYIREQEALTGEQLSFTGFVATCLGKAVDMNRHMQAVRNWRGQLVLFDDVDVNIMVEVELEGRKVPVSHILKAVNKRTYQDINSEIQSVQAVGGRGKQGASLRRFARLPRFIRAPFYWIADKSATIGKENKGTVLLTAVGMFGEGGGWGIPLVSHTLSVTLGGIGEKPGVVDGRIEIREYLSVTITFDHDIIDGAPAARFTERFKDLMESGYGLMVRGAGS
jgi:pyruvate/2-oxoglutarate dehydrogenase complex dihydrolipoamide acyltransferase (E2) component